MKVSRCVYKKKKIVAVVDVEQAEPPKSDKNSKQGSSATVEKNGDAESGSDTDSEKSVRNFDVPVTNGSVGGNF